MVNPDYEPTETEEQVLDALRDEKRANPLLIRERTGLGKGTINTALSNLRAAGWVKRRVRGLYDFVEDPRSGDDGEQNRQEEPDPADATPGVGTEETTIDTPEESAEPENLDDVEFPSTIDRDACLSAAQVAINLIANRGGATKAEIVQEVMPAHPLGYDPDEALGKIEAGERYRGAWWRRVIKPALEATPDVEKPKPGASEWKYIGEEV